MNINNITIANTLNHLKNPNVITGTALIEFPADAGRAYSGYKRGGIVEGSEKLRKEVMSAIVWLCGIPTFNKIGTIICEKLLNIPMDIDYSGTNGGIRKLKEIFKNLKNNSCDTEIISKGRDSISDSVKYLTQGINENNLDVSDLAKYGDKFRGIDPEKLIKKIKGAKQITSITALIINCALMGFILPKINQKITAKKIKENELKNNTQNTKFYSMDEFKKETSKEISFKGLGEFASNIGDWATYGINNSNRFRLISTDLPMIIGRGMTSRNKYEALEVCLMDSAAIYFYNFCLGHCEKLLRKLSSTPDINPKVAQYISSLNIDEAIEKIENNSDLKTVEQIFNKEVKNVIYKEATYGKYGKINKYVQDEELRNIDKSVVKLLKHFKSEKAKNSEIDYAKLIKKMNRKNLAFYGIGTVTSIIGLGILIPKVAYFITKKLTGKDGFIGLEESDKKECK